MAKKLVEADGDTCRVAIDGEVRTLSFDAAYELALQLARWLRERDAMEMAEDSPPHGMH